MEPRLAGADGYKVALVGEALGEKEALAGYPFEGPAGFRLTRLIEWAGLDRTKFDIWNTCWCRPPNNQLEGEAYEFKAVAHCRATKWDHLLSRVNVVVPMGNVPLFAFTQRKGILKARGYISTEGGRLILPTVHPSFIQRGQSKYSAAFIHDIQRAVEIAQHGHTPDQPRYVLDPSPMVALQWAERYVRELSREHIYLAYDIETPGKGDDEGLLESDDLDELLDKSYFIWRISFAYHPHEALSIPWTPEYLPAIRLLLESGGDKVVWNGEFDNPRIRYNGVMINGTIHDGMVAWHILHSDLPKGLGFVATFTCPNQPAWKHLSHQQPAFYNATDSDVELRSFLAIMEELKVTGLWDVYQRDVLDLNPILQHMTLQGMPLDAEVRLDRARRLAERQRVVSQTMEEVVPFNARRIDKVFAAVPKSREGLYSRPSTRMVPCCERCGLERPRTEHFKHYVKKVNPCDGAQKVVREVAVEEWFRLKPFKPSRDQLIHYQNAMGRPVPTTYDKKTRSRKPSMGEKQIKGLIGKYPLDRLYPLVLEYRELDKIAGTYVGRPIDVAQ